MDRWVVLWLGMMAVACTDMAIVEPASVTAPMTTVVTDAEWTVVDDGIQPEASGYFVRAFASNGVLAINQQFGLRSRALVRYTGGSVRRLRPLSQHDESMVRDVNGSGVAVGVSYTGFSDPVPVAWIPNASPQPLEAPHPLTAVEAISGKGVIAGWARGDDQPRVYNAYRWRLPNTQAELLPAPPNAVGVRAFDVNDRGFIAGVIDRDHVLWTPDNTLITVHTTTGQTSALRTLVNNRNDVLVWTVRPLGSIAQYELYRWTKETGSILLVPPTGMRVAQAQGMDREGNVYVHLDTGVGTTASAYVFAGAAAVALPVAPRGVLPRAVGPCGELAGHGGQTGAWSLVVWQRACR